MFNCMHKVIVIMIAIILGGILALPMGKAEAAYADRDWIKELPWATEFLQYNASYEVIHTAEESAKANEVIKAAKATGDQVYIAYMTNYNSESTVPVGQVKQFWVIRIPQGATWQWENISNGKLIVKDSNGTKIPYKAWGNIAGFTGGTEYSAQWREWGTTVPGLMHSTKGTWEYNLYPIKDYPNPKIEMYSPKYPNAQGFIEVPYAQVMGTAPNTVSYLGVSTYYLEEMYVYISRQGVQPTVGTPEDAVIRIPADQEAWSVVSLGELLRQKKTKIQGFNSDRFTVYLQGWNKANLTDDPDITYIINIEMRHDITDPIHDPTQPGSGGSDDWETGMPQRPTPPDENWDVVGWIKYLVDWFVYVVQALGFFIQSFGTAVGDIFSKAVGLTDILAQVFNFLPPQLMTLITLAMLTSIILGLIRR